MNTRYFQVIKQGDHFVLSADEVLANCELKDYEGGIGLRIGINLSGRKCENMRYYFSALPNNGADQSKKVLDLGIDDGVEYGLYMVEKKTGPIDMEETRKIRILHNPKKEPVGFVETQLMDTVRCKNCHSKHYISYDSGVLSTDTCQSCGAQEYIS